MGFMYVDLLICSYLLILTKVSILTLEDTIGLRNCISFTDNYLTVNVYLVSTVNPRDVPCVAVLSVSLLVCAMSCAL